MEAEGLNGGHRVHSHDVVTRACASALGDPNPITKYSEEAIVMANEKQGPKRTGISGLVFVGCLMLGFAIGFLTGNIVAGLFDRFFLSCLQAIGTCWAGDSKRFSQELAIWLIV